MSRRLITAREQYEMLSPWLRVAIIKEARYPQVYPGSAPYGHIGDSGRARNRPPSVARDPNNPDAGVIDPSEIRYVKESDSVSAYHPNGDHLGNYSWEEGWGGDPAHIGVAQVDPKYQGQGVGGGIIDHIREHHHPDLVHSGYRGSGSLSYQGRAAALRDLGNTEEEHNDYFNTRPYNYGDNSPARFKSEYAITPAQQRAHDELMQHYEEDRSHPNYTARTSDSPYDPDMHDSYGDRHDYGYDPSGAYVGLSGGSKDYEGYSEEGYNQHGYDSEGFDRNGTDEEGYDQDGFSDEGLNRDGETRHGYTPGNGEAPEGTIPMSEMASHWAQNGLPTSPEHQDMMDGAAAGFGQTMYAVRQSHQRSPATGDHHIGNGDRLYSSLERAREVAQDYPNDPSRDKDIVSVDHLNPDELHTDITGLEPEDFHYAPDSSHDVEETSMPARIVHDPQRQQRILGDLGQGWSKGYVPSSAQPSMDYTDPNGGRSGRMWQGHNGLWLTEHQPEFGSARRGAHGNYRDAADSIIEGTTPGPTMEHHAMEVNNHFDASGGRADGTGGGEVEWEPHPNGKGLMARTPHGDLHLTQDPATGSWDWHAGPHGFQPGDEGGIRGMLSDALPRAARSSIRGITNRPFHGGLADELGEGWRPHPSSATAHTRQLPSGNHAYMQRASDGSSYTSGIQRDNGRGEPYGTPSFARTSPDIAQAKAFINHRENPVPASDLGKGWEDYELGSRSFPAYTHESHPSGASANVAWANEGGWRPTVMHRADTYQGSPHKTPQEAANWASSLMDDLN